MQLMFQDQFPTPDLQFHCRFNPFELHEIVTNGAKEVTSAVCMHKIHSFVVMNWTRPSPILNSSPIALAALALQP